VFQPAWHKPDHVHALFTERTGGFSSAPYDSLNLGDHVGDAPEFVSSNRASLGLVSTPFWLEQVHSSDIIDVDQHELTGASIADAPVTRTPGQILAVMSADRLPVLLTNVQGDCVAVAHAGWRGRATTVFYIILWRISLMPMR